jgi:type VI secretion system protein ImpF
MNRSTQPNLKLDPQNRRADAAILDRLLLVDNGREKELVNYDAEALRRDVRRSLEILLNTRQPSGSLADDFQALAASTYRYGIPDFTQLGWGGKERLREFCQNVESTIAMFEPRLAAVRVELAEERERRDRILRFRIRARLQVRPKPQEVVYDSVVDPNTSEFEVRSS